MIAAPAAPRSRIVQVATWHFRVEVDGRGIGRARIVNPDGTPRRNVEGVIRRWALGLWAVPPLDADAERPFIWDEATVCALEETYQELTDDTET